jgi:hypothetical protein
MMPKPHLLGGWLVSAAALLFIAAIVCGVV